MKVSLFYDRLIIQIDDSGIKNVRVIWNRKKEQETEWKQRKKLLTYAGLKSTWKDELENLKDCKT